MNDNVTRSLQDLPEDIITKYVFPAMRVREYIKLCSGSSYIRRLCELVSDDIWKHFLKRDFTIDTLDPSFLSYKEAYEYFSENAIFGVYRLPLITTQNLDLAIETIYNIPGSWNEHLLFLKYDPKEDKYIKATIGQHTGAGIFYSINSTELGTFYEDQFDGGLNSMILYIFQEGYHCVVGYIDEETILFSENNDVKVVKKLYKEIKRLFQV